MKKPNAFIILASSLLWLLVGGQLRAEVTLPKVLGDNMVLQRHKPLPIWGAAAPGEKVIVAFGNQTHTTIADAAGQWKVTLAPLPASARPATLTIAGTNKITLENILVGEVWLCSGQSNMEYSMNKSSKHAQTAKSQGLTLEEFKKVNHTNIRVFLVKRDLNKPGNINKGWQEADYENLKDFSAAGYFFAEKLQQELKVPVGIISSAISGSRIEPWISAEAFASSSHFNSVQTAPLQQVDGSETGKFYYGMIQPLAPFALQGFLWYQGESNCFLNETTRYTQKMQVLITSWRQAWHDDKLSFYYVQIAPFYYSRSTGGDRTHTVENLAEFREAQTAALVLPHTGMVVTTDLVDNLEDIHPTYKWEIGRRLALIALAKNYKQQKVTYSGPQYRQMQVKKNKVVLSFSHTGSGLTSQDGKPLTFFTLAGPDGKFVPAEAVIKGNKVVVSAKTVDKPIAVRFAWHEAAQPNLFNKGGLPAVPFRTDSPLLLGELAKE